MNKSDGIIQAIGKENSNDVYRLNYLSVSFRYEWNA